MLHFLRNYKFLTVFTIICHRISAIKLNFTVIEQEFSKLNLTIPEHLKNLSKIDNSTNSTNNYNYNFNNANQIYSLKASTILVECWTLRSNLHKQWFFGPKIFVNFYINRRFYGKNCIFR